jgi:hypothetical protein
MVTHYLLISAMNWEYLSRGDKHFLVLPERHPPIHYGDVFVMQTKIPQQTLTRWVRYVESGIGYAPDWVGVELAP